ncbi:type I-E CRISPR-associated endoribonuclease Cas2e [Leucobacter chinensis]|uniref:type I-E CRISPR-associated endoribonuclease Cas2e n=1 Tax=Leucobacter chinensis TaxID=2851010 RepID=UPI001C22254F|nr:type I-E CRISPR-associated endoribonuclease Cas2e [Leucobacter chinensis]
MIVIVLTSCTAKLRGHLTRWILEISPGVFVGAVNSRVRDLLWEQVLEHVGSGRAIMAFRTNTEQGFEFRVHHHDWIPTDFEGLSLMMRPNTNAKNITKERKAGWSNASRYRRAR